MRNTYNKYKSVILIGLLLLIITSILSGAVFANSNHVFAEENTISANSNTESSELDTDMIAGTNLTIRDYSEQLHATEAAVRISDEDNTGFELYNLDEDDPIINIVPKNYFFTVGNIVNIGDEYGYFINTEETANKTYISTVLVFDITTNTDLVATIDRVIVKVSPIFQYKYAGLTNEATMALFNGVYLNYNTLDESRVVAYPSKMENTLVSHKVEYEMAEDYYIKDVSFGASLYNEQALNYGDVGYDPYNDYGSYFTGFDYSYQGKYREKGEFNVGDMLWNVADNIFTALDYIKFSPGPLGTVANVFGAIYDVISFGKGWIDFASEPSNLGKTEFKTTEKLITATCYYQNRDDQLKYYRDVYGNPVLAKTAEILFDTDAEKSIWYGVGDNVTAYFNIGHSALNGRTSYYTRFTNQLALQIVNCNGDTAVAAGSTIIHDNLRDPETKKLEFLGSGDIYMLPEGEDHLTYKNLMYESDYVVDIALTDNATVNVNGQVKTGKDLSFNVHAKEHGDIQIDLGNNGVGLKGTVSISPNASTIINSISPGGEYLIKTDLAGVKNLQLSNSNLEITKIYLLEDGQLVPYNSYVSLIPGNSVVFPFEKGQKYYIVIKNDSLNIVRNAIFQVNNIKSFYPEQNITVDGSTKALTFINTYDSSMSFQFILQENEQINLSIFNENGESISSVTILETGGAKYSFALPSNKACYMYFSLTSSISFIVLPNENYIKWEIDGNLYDLDYHISLPRGEEYTIRLFYQNGNTRYEVDTDYNIDNRYDYFTFSNNRLNITYNIPYDYVITIIPLNYPNSTLRITPSKGREDYEYTVTLDRMGGNGGIDQFKIHYNDELPISSKPYRTGYTFKGYYTKENGGGVKYYDLNMDRVRSWDIESDTTLYASWQINVYTITYRYAGGVGGATYASNPTTYTVETLSFELKKPTKKGYKGEWDMPIVYQGTVGNLTITFNWEPIQYRIMVAYVDYDIWDHIGNEKGTYYYLKYDKSMTFTAKGYSGYRFMYWVTCDTATAVLPHEQFPIYSYDTTINVKNLTTKDGDHVDVVACYEKEEACITTGTYIMLANGSQVPVESLTGNEMLLVWNMYTGSYDVAPILCIDSDPIGHYELIKLSFSDGTTVDVISEHGFFDVDLNKYVYLDEYAADYIGHCFLKQGESGMTAVTLVDVEVSTEVTVAYSPVTYGHLCYFVNGMLSMPGGIDGLFNIFEVDPDTMMYDTEAMAADIQEYGLFTYEELNALVPVPEEMFEAVNGQYLKVAMGKGLITLDQIQDMVDNYSDLFEV